MTVLKALPAGLIDSLLADYKKPEDLIGENGLLKQITKAVVERALQAEMAAHLGHGKHEPVENPAGNTRNGKVIPPFLASVRSGVKQRASISAWA